MSQKEVLQLDPLNIWNFQHNETILGANSLVAYPNYNIPFHIHKDAYDNQMSAVII